MYCSAAYMGRCVSHAGWDRWDGMGAPGKVIVDMYLGIVIFDVAGMIGLYLRQDVNTMVPNPYVGPSPNLYY
jgi:hypothetical protein